MQRLQTSLFLRALGLGAVAGMRSMTAPALLSYFLSHRKGSARLNSALSEPLANPAVANALGLLAVGELIVDKLPITPNRTLPPSVAFRALSGAVVGSALYESRNQSRATGAMVGALAAVAATYGAFALRRALSRKGVLPDPVLGAVEDAIALRSGVSALRP